MIIISDLNYVEEVSASSIVGGANQIYTTSTATTSTNNYYVAKQAGFYIQLPNPNLTPTTNSVTLANNWQLEKALLAL